MKKNVLTTVFPVMFGFFIMAFVDVVGIATNYVKADLPEVSSDFVSSLISFACFIWFLLLSVPTGILLNKFGRKNMVIASFAVTFLALLLPVVSYTFPVILICFALLGIGNTILQVSMNPLVTDVVSSEKLTGTLTLGQFLKAVCSFFTPIVASACAGTAFGWKWIFPVYAAISLIAAAWLFFAPIEKKVYEGESLRVSNTFALLRDKYILLFFIAILILVGADVGMGVTFPKILKERFSLTEDKATLGNSLYFLARTVSAFCGGILLMKLKEDKFYLVSILVALLGLVMMIFANSYVTIIISVLLFGLGYANLFSIIFGLAIKRRPDKANEVSALLVTGIAGGAIVTPLLGIVTDLFDGNQTAAVITLIVFWVYILALALPIFKLSKTE